MLFNSYEFIFAFLPFTFFVYFFLLNKKFIFGAKSFLVLASLTFYSWWNVFYLPLIVGSMLINFQLGQRLSRKSAKKSRRNLLTLGVLFNLSLLGYFKYSDFFIENINFVFSTDIPYLYLALPLAVSFFTFQQIAYLVDSYKEKTKEYDFLNYALFVSFFPQLIAGPIVHHKEMMPQFTSSSGLLKNYRNITLGLFVFSIGLFKKVVIADSFAKWANIGFDLTTSLNFFEAWVTSLSYTFQLYFDFSGYTDMAIGAALLFNIKLPTNFNSPYKATNIQDFWRRWHITLSHFLRDYIYIPLGGNRKSELRAYSNLMLTFLIGGLWHGAGWTFIFWGGLHGLALCVHRLWKSLNFKMWGWIAWFITFNFVNIAWVFFRAKEWEDAIKVLKGMFGLNGIVLPKFLTDKLSFLSKYGVEFGSYLKAIYGDNSTILFLSLGFAISIFCKNTMELKSSFKFNALYGLTMIFAFVYSWIHLSNVSAFLYFNF